MLNGIVDLQVREMTQEDVPFLVDYWLKADANYLLGMGVDVRKLPSRESLTSMLLDQLQLAMSAKKSYCIIWLLNNLPVGHSNLNPLFHDEEAFMHLHIWVREIRRRGFGSDFLKMSIPWYFEKTGIKRLISEPYALNPAPHKILAKTGFDFVKEYTTIPGSLNFEQPVKRWEMSREKYNSLNW